MNAFDKLIGYESIKTELLQICDMIHHQDVYVKLGAKLPRGVLLYGDPGLGKTLMANCFITEAGLPVYTLRRNKGTDSFVDAITNTFREAKAHAPAILFLDDMDKFSNEDSRHPDTKEYVAVQSGIDETRDSGVFVFATANDIDKLPDSLLRPGRFDRKIEVNCPSKQDAHKIIAHYLQNKPIADDVNLEDVAMMIRYSSCAELETILNEAAIRAGYRRRSHIAMEDLVESVLRMEYEAPGDDCSRAGADQLRRIALHEAGHAVVCEALMPGSVGLVSLRTRGENEEGGFVRQCCDFHLRTHRALVFLGGRAAEELFYPDASIGGSSADLRSAAKCLRAEMKKCGSHGFGFVDVAINYPDRISESLNAHSEAVVQAELERMLCKAREILISNRVFLEKTAEALLAKETLLHSDIRTLREAHPVKAA